MRQYITKSGFDIIRMFALLFFAFFLPSKAALAQDNASITINFGAEAPLDSVQVTVWNHFILGGNVLGITKTAVNDKVNSKTFKFSVTGKQGIFILKKFKGNIPEYSTYYPFLAGDEVSVLISSNQLSFTGIGSKKMQIAYELDSIQSKLREQYYDAPSPKKGLANTKGSWERMTSFFFELPLDSLLNVKLACLEKYKSQLSVKDFQWLKGNTISNDYHMRLSKFNRYNGYGLLADSTQRPFYTNIYLQHLKGLIPKIPDSVFIQCPTFGSIYLFQRSFSLHFDPGFPKDKRGVVEYTTTLPKSHQETFMTCFLLMRGMNKMDDSLVSRALPFVKSPDYLRFFNSLRQNIRIGDLAYDFSLENVNGNKVRLSDFKGKVVFMDFWFTGCKWCKNYYENTLKYVEEHYKGSKEIVFLSICVDDNRKSWLGSVADGSYNGSGSINLYTGGEGLNHKLIKHYNITGYPTQIIIDREMKNFNVHNGIRTMSSEDLIIYLDKVVSNQKDNK